MYDGIGKITGNLSVRTYNIVIGITLLWGFGINALMCKYCTETFMHWNPIAIIIGYFVSAITGIILSRVSDNPAISFLGYNLVVLPIGVVLSIALREYDKVSIFNAFLTTTIVTAIMIILACSFPNVFLSMGKTLFIALIAVIICEFIFMLIKFTTPSIWDWLVALIFCGYIGYDWAKAQQKEYTLDNAIDSVVSLYLDIINLFIRILSASGKKKD